MRMILVHSELPGELMAAAEALSPLGRVISLAQRGPFLEWLDGTALDLVVVGLASLGDEMVHHLGRIRSGFRRFLPVVLSVDTDLAIATDCIHARDLADAVLKRPLLASELQARATALLNLKKRFDVVDRERRSLERFRKDLEAQLAQQRELADQAFRCANALCSSAIVVRCNVDYVAAEVDTPADEAQLALAEAKSAAQRVEGCVRDLFAATQTSTKPFSIRLSRCAFSVVVNAATENVRAEARERNVNLLWDFAADTSVEADPALLTGGLECLLRSAIRCARLGGRVYVKARQQEDFEITISSPGPFLSDDRAHALVPMAGVAGLPRASGYAKVGVFSAVPGVAELAYSRRVVAAHGGSMSCETYRQRHHLSVVYRVRLPRRIRAVV